jgi:glycerophosphoryl diester phosphodiesterase
VFALITTFAHAKFMLAGHRGASANAPENTLASFNKAKTVADFVEYDVWSTSDGQLVVIHDATVDRTTNGKGSVAAMTLAEVRALDAGSWFGSAFAGEKIPTAEETIRAIQTEAAPLMERKGGTVAQFVDLLNRVPLRAEGVVMSFDYAFIVELKKAKPLVQVGWLGSGALTSAQITQAVADGVTHFVWSWSDLTAEAVAQIHQGGGLVFAWTINDLGTLSALNDRGVDGIITDHAVDFANDAAFASPFASGQVLPQSRMVLPLRRAGLLSAAARGHAGRYVQWRRAGETEVIGTGRRFLLSADNPQRYGRYVASWKKDDQPMSAEYEVASGDIDNRLVNISARMTVGPGEAVGIVGFVVKSADTPRFMVRAIGPSLTGLGVTDAIAQPSLTVYKRSTVIDSDSMSSRVLATGQDFQRNGAFPLAPLSGDVAIMKDLGGGAYTAQLSSRNNQTGVGLIEVYQDNTDPNWALGSPVNISLRGRATPTSPLIGGFVVPAGTSQTLLVRGIGPALAQYGINEPLRDPMLRIYDSKGVVVAENDDWWDGEDATLIRNRSIEAGAFKIATGREAGMLVTLTPGAYTAVLSDTSTSRSGVGLLEIYAISTDTMTMTTRATIASR